MHFLLTIFLAVLASTAIAEEAPLVDDTPEAACKVLQEKIATLSLPSGKPDKLWFCDHSTIKNEYFYFMALRSMQVRGVPDEIHSNLIGWFGVARRSNIVLEWDIGEDRLVKISDAYSSARPAK